MGQRTAALATNRPGAASGNDRATNALEFVRGGSVEELLDVDFALVAVASDMAACEVRQVRQVRQSSWQQAHC